MCETYLDEFKKEMAPAEKLYTAEIRKFAKKNTPSWEKWNSSKNLTS